MPMKAAGLSPNLGMLQQAARQRTDSHKLHIIKYLHAIPILQDVAVNGINVEGEHAPEHALEPRRLDAI